MTGMTWLFAFVIVAALGVVAVVAAGRGGSMAQTYDDRPDSRVPADGPLTSVDLRRVRLTTAFRGYRMSEVDALLDRLSAQLDGRSPENDLAENDLPEDHVPEARSVVEPVGEPARERPEESGRSDASGRS